MTLNSHLSTKELMTVFAQPEFNVEHLNDLFSLDIKNLNFPLLPNILLENNKIDCLKVYLKNIANSEYLIIHFFSENKNLSHDIMAFAHPYIDNLLAISLDQLNLEHFFELNKQFPGNIKEQTITKLIKIYETNQKHYFDLPHFQEVENTIINAVDQFNDKMYVFHNELNHIEILPLYMKIAHSCFKEDSLHFLDDHFKKNLPSYMHNYIDNLKLHRNLEAKLVGKTKENTKIKI